MKLLTILLLLLTAPVHAAAEGPLILHAITSIPGIFAVIVFIFAYILVVFEEFLHLRKSKPVILASGIIWMLVAYLAQKSGHSHQAELAAKHNIQEYGELLLFLLVAMTYVNAMQERKVFEAIRAWMITKGLSFKQLFWATGFLAFFISPIADNLTTALLMCAIVMAIGQQYKSFVSICCVNIVVAANAGGAYSPFGDITTLMVWQKGLVEFKEFFAIFIPSLISYAIPATIMSLFIPNGAPEKLNVNVTMEEGAKRIVLLFLVTIIIAITFHAYFYLPPALGMMMGLGLLKLFSYYLKIKHEFVLPKDSNTSHNAIDVLKSIEKSEWDTLLFFYGIILCVGGLSTIGYLEWMSNALYQQLGTSLPAYHHATPANIMLGFISAIIDNIPVMFAVLTMLPEMSHGQWLLITLTTGIGGSLLSVGSAAGVALMGQARGMYTFFSHLKWTPVIAIGYLAGVFAHIWLNKPLFFIPVTN